MWSTLNEKNTLNWMAGKSLQLPTRAFTMADRNDTYFYFDVKQEGSGRFTRFAWEILKAQNELRILKTDNLREIGFNVASWAWMRVSRSRLRLSMRDNIAI